MNTRRAVYPGTFDPITFGHIDVIRRAAHIFDEVIIGVAHNGDKKPLFDIEERVKMVKIATKGIRRIVLVEDFNCLTVKFLRRHKARIMIRGLRMLSDFEYEFQMALTNRKLDENIETVFMMPSEQYSYISSKLIKEIAYLGASLSSFVPEFVERALKEKLQTKNI